MRLSKRNRVGGFGGNDDSVPTTTSTTTSKNAAVVVRLCRFLLLLLPLMMSRTTTAKTIPKIMDTTDDERHHSPISIVNSTTTANNSNNSNKNNSKNVVLPDTTLMVTTTENTDTTTGTGSSTDTNRNVLLSDTTTVCYSADIEHVNTVQLYEILQNLKHTSVIRNVRIDIQPNKCLFSPLQQQPPPPKPKTTTPNPSATTTTTTFETTQPQTQPQTIDGRDHQNINTNQTEPTHITMTKPSSSSSSSFGFRGFVLGGAAAVAKDDDDDGQCNGGSIGDELDDDADPPCTVNGGSGSGRKRNSSTGSRQTNSSGRDQTTNDDEPAEPTPLTVITTTTTTTRPAALGTAVPNLFTSTSDGDKEDDDGQCNGGSVGDELDDDAEPLCTVQGGSSGSSGGGAAFGSFASSKGRKPKTTNSFSKLSSDTAAKSATFPTSSTTGSTSSSSSIHSNVLHHLQQTGFTSQSQEETFTWRDMTDTVFTEVANTNNTNATTNTNRNNNEDRLQPDNFWDDMCSALWNGKDRSSTHDDDDDDMINLALNPERNTGYNGTHIWRAIYDENCIVGTTNQNNRVDGGGGDVVVEDMCYEERVLYRLLSGLHSSTTISIAKHYYPPSKKKNRTSWESNPSYFMDHVYYNPEYIRNLHFTYVVLLRALSKASTFLYQYDFNTTMTDYNVDDDDSTFKSENNHDPQQYPNDDLLSNDEDIVMTQKLVRRLLDSSILQSCHSVFSAFDESLMFQEENYTSSTDNASSSSIFPNVSTNTTSSASSRSAQKVDVASLRQNFKGIFQNVSSILDCVQCQQCKLHGKLVMLGYGTALKILLNQNSIPELDHNEIIALINTVIKFSESIKDVRELTNLYVVQQQQEQKKEQLDRDRYNAVVVVPTPTTNEQQPTKQPISRSKSNIDSTAATTTSRSDLLVSESSSISSDIALIDLAVNVIASLGRDQRITLKREEELIQLVFQRNTNLLVLVKHYHNELDKFLNFSRNIVTTTTATGANTATMVATDVPDPTPDAIVVGSGLAGMATTLNMLDRGGRVILIEKEHVLGGNSGKASSGINACCTPNSTNGKDSMDLFWNDTFRSAGTLARNELITTLISKSADAVTWLQNRLGVDLSLVAQLGGHSTYRTHRPKNGMVGAEIIYAIQKAIKVYVKEKKVTILTDTKVTELLTDDHGAVIGVEYMSSNKAKNDRPKQLYATNVVLATGGFASDRSEGSYLSQYRPELMKMPATAGSFSTGDGIKLATQLGAAIVDMDKVQVHPTGWVDPNDPDNRSKILAGELMRGVGGILLNSSGQRFCNELGTRAYVTNQMLSHDPIFAQTGNWSLNAIVPTFTLLLSSSAAADGRKHVDLYSHKGLLTRLDGVSEVAKFMKLPRDIVVRSLREYQRDAADGIDSFGKNTFKGMPASDLDNEVFYAGTVTPVLHYCMGGIQIDTNGSVLNSQGEIIPGLHAAGEVSGGVHGVNRLGGNSLLECTVYGTIVGQKLPIRSTATPATMPNSSGHDRNENSTSRKDRIITASELQKHNTPDDCWIAIYGIVYDLTDFAEEHPAGAQSIHELAGLDGTDAFAAVHNPNMLEDFDEEIKGRYAIP